MGWGVGWGYRALTQKKRGGETQHKTNKPILIHTLKRC